MNPTTATPAATTDALPAPLPEPVDTAPVAEGMSASTGAAAAPDFVEPVASTPQASAPAVVAQMPARTKLHAGVAQPPRDTAFSKAPEGPGIGGALFALVLVVALILGLGWLARRMPGVGRASNNNALRVVGSLTLGPRDRVMVVEVGSTQLLIGVGQNGMTTLHTLSEPLPVAQPSQGTITSPFAQLLAQQFGKKP